MTLQKKTDYNSKCQSVALRLDILEGDLRIQPVISASLRIYHMTSLRFIVLKECGHIQVQNILWAKMIWCVSTILLKSSQTS